MKAKLVTFSFGITYPEDFVKHMDDDELSELAVNDIDFSDLSLADIEITDCEIEP